MALFLIDAGADVANTPAPLIHAAVVRRDIDMVTLLLAAGADPNHTSGVGFSHRWDVSRSTPLSAALERNDLGMARLLVEGGASLRTVYEGNQASILFRVHLIERGSAERWIELLVSSGADVNHQNNYGNTALMDAIGWDREDIVRALVNVGTDLSITNEWGRTALDVAESLFANTPRRRHENPALLAILDTLRSADEYADVGN